MKIYVTLITKTVYLATIFINSLFAQTQQEIDMELKRLNQAIQGEWLYAYGIHDYERDGYDIGIVDSTFMSKFDENYRFNYYDGELTELETASYHIYYGECEGWEGYYKPQYFIELCYENQNCYCLHITISQDGNRFSMQSDTQLKRDRGDTYLRKEYYLDEYLKKEDK